MITVTPRYHPVGKRTIWRSRTPTPRWSQSSRLPRRRRRPLTKSASTRSRRSASTAASTLTWMLTGAATAPMHRMSWTIASVRPPVCVPLSACCITVCLTQRETSLPLVPATRTISAWRGGAAWPRCHSLCPAYGAILLSNAATGWAQSVAVVVADTKPSDFGTLWRGQILFAIMLPCVSQSVMELEWRLQTRTCRSSFVGCTRRREPGVRSSYDTFSCERQSAKASRFYIIVDIIYIFHLSHILLIVNMRISIFLYFYPNYYVTCDFIFECECSWEYVGVCFFFPLVVHGNVFHSWGPAGLWTTSKYTRGAFLMFQQIEMGIDFFSHDVTRICVKESLLVYK